MKIKDLPSVDRPREKLEKYGPEKLSNSELLAILLRTGSTGLNVIELSRRLLSKIGNGKLPHATVQDLKKQFGLGAAKACEIVACFELGRRLLQHKKAELYLWAHDVWQELRDIRDAKKEHFVVLFLDTRNQEIKRETITIGTLNSNLIHPREVFEPAIRHTAAHIIVAHNPPPAPRRPRSTTKKPPPALPRPGNFWALNCWTISCLAKHDTSASAKTDCSRACLEALFRTAPVILSRAKTRQREAVALLSRAKNPIVESFSRH